MQSGIQVVVSGTVLAKAMKTSKNGNQFGKIRIGWMNPGDEEGRGASAGMYDATVSPEVAATCNLNDPITLVASGREKDFKIDCGFFEIPQQSTSRRRAA